MPRVRRLLGAHRACSCSCPSSACGPRTRCSSRGIGCSSRFPYYMNTYGIHSIHGRAPAVATGVALARPDLDVWVVTGDGDGLSIGGNHLIHALRRNVNMTILLFNNQIYGLTKGQYSPTSEVGKVTKSSPFGSLDHPFNPISVALGAEATLRRPHPRHGPQAHAGGLPARARAPGAAFVEIYQNCNVFNDGAFEHITSRDKRAEMLVDLRARRADPLRCRAGATASGSTSTARPRSSTSPTSARARCSSTTRPRHDPTVAFALSRLAETPTSPTPVGVFRAVQRPTLRGRGAEPARRGAGDPRPRRPPGADRVRPASGTSPERARRRTSTVDGETAGLVELRNTRPVRGFGAKNVVFCGMRTRASAAARIWATVTGGSRIAASTSPAATIAATAAASWRYVTS